MSDDMDRVVVFMDYQNVHGWARRQFLPFGADPSDGHVFPLKIGELLTGRRRRESELMEVRVYRGRPNPERQPGAAAANDRQSGLAITAPMDESQMEHETAPDLGLNSLNEFRAAKPIESGSAN